MCKYPACGVERDLYIASYMSVCELHCIAGIGGARSADVTAWKWDTVTPTSPFTSYISNLLCLSNTNRIYSFYTSSFLYTSQRTFHMFICVSVCVYMWGKWGGERGLWETMYVGARVQTIVFL